MCSTTTGPRRLPPCPEHMMSSSSVPKGADTCQAGCRPTVRDLDKGSIGAAYIRFMQKLTMHRNRQCDSSNLDSNRSQNSTRLDTSSVASAAVLVVVSEIGMVSCSDAAKANVLASESAVSLQTLYWPNLQLHSRREHRRQSWRSLNPKCCSIQSTRQKCSASLGRQGGRIRSQSK